ncbi:MAG TPA: hypothetical protein VGM41_07910 [Chitinophagaceae bacterium]
MKKYIYKWHRTFSLIIALPVLLWASSGFLHPIMTNIRPKIATQWLPPLPVDTAKIKIPLEQALQKNHIDRFANTRIITIGGQPFYQVRLPNQPQLVYISTQNGRRLTNGDELYARHLARQFLEGVQDQPAVLPAGNDWMTDCCKNATVAVLDEAKGAKVSSVELVQDFDNEYNYINRLLPVYKVSFARADGIRVYVETGQDRFAFAMDNKREVFDRLFTFFHTLGWLDALGRFKHVVELLVMSMAFLTTLMGIYIFFSTKTKKPHGNEVLKARRNHRWVSIVVALFTLMFTFSGGFHAFSKLAPDDTGRYFVQPVFLATDIHLDMERLQQAIGPARRITNISLVRWNNTRYWQVFNDPAASGNQPAGDKPPTHQPPVTTDLMKSQSAAAPTTIYVDAEDYHILEQGEEQYAQYLATVFSKHPATGIIKTELVTKFTDEYGFVNKRLPVWKLSYALNNNERYYVETSTGRLATRINDKALVEGYSFALLHKHEFMAWAGKPVKDFSTMFWAGAQVAMITVGLILYSRSRRRKKRNAV